MGKIRQDFNLSNLGDDPAQLARFVSILRDDLITIINGNLEFDQNLKTSTITAKFTKANATTAFDHGLGRVPQGYILTKSNVATSIYDGGSDNTDSVINLKSTAIANTTIVVF